MRSLLFAPGNDRRKITKALESQADCVVLDLEDAVALNAKTDGRTTVVEALRAVPPRPGTLCGSTGGHNQNSPQPTPQR